MEEKLKKINKMDQNKRKINKMEENLIFLGNVGKNGGNYQNRGKI